MPQSFSTFLEIIPIPKARPRMARSGHAYTDPKTRKYEKDLKQLMQAMKPPLFDVPISVAITFHLPKPKSVKRQYPSVKPDLDNYVKALDAFNGFLFTDDSLICELHAFKRYASKPGIEITITSL